MARLLDRPAEAATLELRVYYEDTDAGGVAYHTSYLRWFERGRTEWLRTLGFGQAELAARSGCLFVVRSLAVDYLAPARLDDRVAVVSRVRVTGRTRMTFTQEARDLDGGGRTLCRARVEVVCMDTGGRPRALPQEILKRLDDVG